jgi:SAM-dependent methyltransferase
VADPNVEAWTRANADYTDARAEEAWAKDEVDWGVWHVPESELHALPDVTGKDVVELGCGTGYVGAWLKKLGAARVVGVDPTPAQLETARRCNERFGRGLEFVEAFAEDVPLPDAAFDLAVSEYGASIWADPYAWIPEAERLLRPGGRLIFLINATLLMLCMPDEERAATNELLRPMRGLHRLEWSEDVSVNFALGYGDWIRLLRANGFEIEDLRELWPAPGATTDFPFVTPEWAAQWPSEEVWIARKRV